VAWTQTNLDEINAALASGVTRVVYTNGSSRREVEYQSVKDMLTVRDLIRKELGLTTTTSGRSLAQFSKGLC